MTTSLDNKSLVTAAGKNWNARLASGQTTVPPVSHIAFGDMDHIPTGGENALQNEVLRLGIGTASAGTDVAYFETYIEAAQPQLTIREFGLFNEDGDMLAVGRRNPALIKLGPESGTADSIYFGIEVLFTDITDAVVTIDPNIGVSIERFLALECAVLGNLATAAYNLAHNFHMHRKYVRSLL